MTLTEFTFAWDGADSPDGPWAHLHVVRFHGREELSALARYEITLLAKSSAPDVDPRDLVGARATLRIATLSRPAYRVTHGVITEAEEIGPLPDGMLYRAVIVPPLVRAKHRTRCRIFLEKTTRQILDAVLQGDARLAREDNATVEDDDGDLAAFRPAVEKFTWRIAEPKRIDDVAVRPYCVQYNESDLAFVSRLLEEEGLSYHIENGAGLCLLVLSDTDQGKARLDPFEPLGADRHGRTLAAMKLGSRLRESAVRLREFDWRKPALDLTAEAKRDDDDLFEVRYPGGYANGSDQGEALARARLDRYRIEAEYAAGEGSCRLLSAGSVFALEHPRPTHEGEYLVTRLDVCGEQRGVATTLVAKDSVPFVCSLECARRGRGSTIEASLFRPSRSTQRPRIVGSQTAFVTADPSTPDAEIHVGGPPGAEIGCVRLRFHWDREQSRLAKEPSSCWVRVSQAFAGLGEGGVWHPRVGVEVIVEFIDGDPDRPIITGRVYNGANRPPAPAVGSPTVSTFKSFSSPGGGAYNEFSFDDGAGHEQVKLHAAKDWNSDAGHDRSETVANDSASNVGANRTETTGGSRSTSVTGDNAETVDGEESVSVGASRRVSVGADHHKTVAANQTLKVGANRSVIIGADRSAQIGANDSLLVGGSRGITVAGDRKEAVGGSAEQTISGAKKVTVSGNGDELVSGARSVTVSGTMTHTIAGAVTLNASADMAETIGANLAVSAGANATMQAGADLSLLAAAEAALKGATVHVTASGEIVLSAGGSAIKISGGGVEITGSAIKIAGGAVDVTGGMVKIN